MHTVDFLPFVFVLDKLLLLMRDAWDRLST